MHLNPLSQAPTPVTPKEQGVILVTKRNAEVNAGFVVLRESNHAPPLSEDDWSSIPLGPENMQEQAIVKFTQVSAY